MKEDGSACARAQGVLNPPGAVVGHRSGWALQVALRVADADFRAVLRGSEDTGRIPVHPTLLLFVSMHAMSPGRLPVSLPSPRTAHAAVPEKLEIRYEASPEVLAALRTASAFCFDVDSTL